MINGATPMEQDVIKNGYDDWVALLTYTGNRDMLNDPYAVWVEAFHVATLFERHGIIHAIQTQLELITPQEFDNVASMTIDEVKQVQLRMLQQVLDLIASKGLSRTCS